MNIENLTIEQLREKHKDILESKGVKRLIELKRGGETASFGDQSPEANKYVINNQAYSKNSKLILTPLLDLYNTSKNI